MPKETTYGMDITKLKRHIEVTGIQRIKEFFKSHKTKAFRMCEVETIFKNKLTIYAVRSAIKKLYDIQILNKKQFLQNKSYYFWNKNVVELTATKKGRPTKIALMKRKTK